MSQFAKIKTILILNHLILLVGLFYASPVWLLLSIVGTVLFGRIGQEIALHRYFSHRSFKMAKWKEIVTMFLSVFSGAGSPMMWVGIHRKHHAFSDQPGDPHGNQSALRVWSTFWEPFEFETKYVKELMRDPLQRFVHRHYFKIYIVGYLLMTAIDWRIAVFLASGGFVISIHTAGAVNTLCHKYGYRNFETADKSTNNSIVNFFAMGSGLHNNHHARPTDWTTKVKDNEYDFCGWIIEKFLKEN